MAKIRQEINILDHVLTSTAGATSCNERVLLDTTQYNGTVTYYFEIVGKSNLTANINVTLRRAGTSTDDATCTINTGVTTDTVIRSSSFTPPAGSTEYMVTIASEAEGPSATVKSARIVIIQEATTLTNTETQIEIGNYNLARTTESAAILTNPKYWKYDASKWDGTKTFYAEAVYDSGDMDTITVALYESTAIDAPSWSSVATIVSAGTTTVPTRTRVSFTPTDGRWYTIFSLNGSMDNHDIYRAGVVVQQNYLTLSDSYSETNGDSDHSFTGNFISVGQSFNATAGVLDSVKLYLKKTLSPTGNLTAKIFEHTGTYGTDSKPSNGSSPIATSDNIDVTTLGTSYALSTFSFSGANRITLTAGTKYVLILSGLGLTADASNFPSVIQDNSSGTHGGNRARSIDSEATWAAAAADIPFYVYVVGGLTKLEPQYLLANTKVAPIITTFQTFLTDWDSTEWDDGAGSTTYYFQCEAGNGSGSDVELWEADGGGSAIGTVTNIDNAQISAAMTMPADQNLDIQVTTNTANDVAAARILVTYVFSAAATAALTGTVTTATETDIVTGGKTIILTLTGDTFIAAGTGPIGSTANTQALIDGIDSAQSEGTGWNAVVQPGIETTDVVRTSDTVATITLDAEASYAITANETITATIPAAVLTGATPIVATPTFTITATSTGVSGSLLMMGMGQ